MDKHSHRIINPEKVLRTMNPEDFKAQPRKVNRQEFMASPEFQRRMKIAAETAERDAFEKRLAFRQAQAQNPIKGRPRKKRGRKSDRKRRTP